jgi:hypothetical protein
MGKKKASKVGATRTGKPKPPKASAPKARPAGGRRAAARDDDAELLAQLLTLQERTAAVGRQLRAIGEMVSTVMRETTITAAEMIEQVGGAVDAESPTPPPVAARPRRPRSGKA